VLLLGKIADSMFGHCNLVSMKSFAGAGFRLMIFVLAWDRIKLYVCEEAFLHATFDLRMKQTYEDSPHNSSI